MTSWDSMGVYGDLMGVYGDFMEFNGSSWWLHGL